MGAKRLRPPRAGLTTVSTRNGWPWWLPGQQVRRTYLVAGGVLAIPTFGNWRSHGAAHAGLSVRPGSLPCSGDRAIARRVLPCASADDRVGRRLRGGRNGDAWRSLLQDPDGDLQHQDDRRHDQRSSRNVSRSHPGHREHHDHLDRRPRRDDAQRHGEAVPNVGLLHDRHPAQLLGGVFPVGGGFDQPHRGDPHHERRWWYRPGRGPREDRRGDSGVRLVPDDYAERDRRQHDQQPHLPAVLRWRHLHPGHEPRRSSPAGHHQEPHSRERGRSRQRNTDELQLRLRRRYLHRLQRVGGRHRKHV